MRLLTNEVYHLYNRGNDRQLLFYQPHNYRHFLQMMKHHLVPNCNLLAYCLMPNHFHLLISPNRKTNLPYIRPNGSTGNPKVQMTKFSHALQQLLSRYAKAMNAQYHRTGSLFTQNTRIKPTSSDFFTDDYSVWCFIYIHQNPVKAGLVPSPDQWEFSSYRDYLTNDPRSMCNLPMAYKKLCLTENEVAGRPGEAIPGHFLAKIR